MSDSSSYCTELRVLGIVLNHDNKIAKCKTCEKECNDCNYTVWTTAFDFIMCRDCTSGGLVMAQGKLEDIFFKGLTSMCIISEDE